MGSKECAYSVLESAIVVCLRSEQVSKAEAWEIVVEGCDVVGRLSSPSCVTRFASPGRLGDVFAAQPAGNLLTRKASRGLPGQLPRGGPRPESVLPFSHTFSDFLDLYRRVTLFGVSARGGKGVGRLGGCVSGLQQFAGFLMTFTVILTPQKERRAFKNKHCFSDIETAEKAPRNLKKIPRA